MSKMARILLVEDNEMNRDMISRRLQRRGFEILFAEDGELGIIEAQKELPDLIQCAIDEGNIVKSFLICKEYINVNFQEELDKTRSYFAHL